VKDESPWVGPVGFFVGGFFSPSPHGPGPNIVGWVKLTPLTWTSTFFKRYCIKELAIVFYLYTLYIEQNVRISNIKYLQYLNLNLK